MQNKPAELTVFINKRFKRIEKNMRKIIDREVSAMFKEIRAELTANMKEAGYKS